MQRLQGQLALITGAGSGIGKAISIALDAEGASSFLVGRTESKLVATGRELSRPPASIIPTDLGSEEDVRRLAMQIGNLDILVLAAGEYGCGAIEHTDTAEFDRLYRANLRGNYLLTRSLLPGLRRSSGQIVFINSSSGLEARANLAIFSAANHALKALADSLRAEVNADGLRVTSVFSGRTATPRQRAIYNDAGEEYNPELLLQPEDIAAVVVAALTLARTAELTNVTVRPLRKSY